MTATEAYRTLVVAYRNGAPVLLSDVADIVDGLENARVGAWYDGRPAVILDVMRQPGANVVETVEQVRRQIPRLQRQLPAGIDLTVVHDRTGTIQASIRDVQFTLTLAVALVVLVVLLFLRTMRATIIAGTALPLSLVATFAVMWACGFSLDNLSLMALTIGTGFVVDDAIVMIENIVRHIEKGEDPMPAALKGAREIGFTIISLTASLVAVFIPLLFMSGIVGRMFREFALTLTIAVVVSAIVSLTLTPMMCARILRAGRQGVESAGLAARAFAGVVEGYRRSLLVCLRHPVLMMLSLAATLAATLWLYVEAPKGFLPTQDTGLVTAVAQAEATASFDEMRRVQGEVSRLLREDPDVASVVTVIGVNALNLTGSTARLMIVLHPRAERADDAGAVIERLQRRVAGMPGVSVTFQSVQDVQISTRASRAQYQYSLTGPDYAEVARWADLLAERLRAEPSIRDVATEARNEGAQLFVRVDREKAGRLGVSLQAVNDTLNDAFGQRQISTIYAHTNQYRVILEAQPRYHQDSDSLGRLHVAGAGGAQVPLSAFATVTRTSAPQVVGHDEQFPSVVVSFNLAPRASLGDALGAIAAAERAAAIPDTIVGRYYGDAAEFARSLEGQPWLILAAIVTIYIVLGVLYESAVHPVTILSTLPSAG